LESRAFELFVGDGWGFFCSADHQLSIYRFGSMAMVLAMNLAHVTVVHVKMEKMSKMDLPTNLYNHKTFHEHLERLWESFKQNSIEFHLAVLDLDNFKKINDVFGHAVGDVVIRETAEIINAFVDTNDYASRYGGEEFAILFTEKSLHSCLVTLELIRKSLEAFKFDDMGSNNVTDLDKKTYKEDKNGNPKSY
jgi:diguanylate cyclase (GGDEF)-like protein